MKKEIEKKGTTHDKHLKQLNRIAGQVKGIANMIEDQRYCVDILTQIKAVKSSLASIEKKVIEKHLDHCVHEALASKNKARVDEVMKEISDLLKSIPA